MTPPEIIRRAVAESDCPFLFELYASTRAAELALTNWTPAQKHAFLSMQFQGQLAGYRETYPEATHEILTIEGRPVGRLYIFRASDRIHILDLTIAPESRNAGIGSRVLRQILEEGDHAGKPVSIYVESFNPSLRLFQRLDFRIAKQDSFQLLLERLPAST